MASRKRDYKAEYKRRIASATKKGKTRQQARGHVPQEHVYRKTREREAYGITLAEQRIVRNWAAKRREVVHDSTLTPDEVVDWAKDVGYDVFKNYRSGWEQLRAGYAKRKRGKGYEPQYSIVELGNFADADELPDISWLYYH